MSAYDERQFERLRNALAPTLPKKAIPTRRLIGADALRYTPSTETDVARTLARFGFIPPSTLKGTTK